MGVCHNWDISASSVSSITCETHHLTTWSRETVIALAERFAAVEDDRVDETRNSEYSTHDSA